MGGGGRIFGRFRFCRKFRIVALRFNVCVNGRQTSEVVLEHLPINSNSKPVAHGARVRRESAALNRHAEIQRWNVAQRKSAFNFISPRNAGNEDPQNLSFQRISRSGEFREIPWGIFGEVGTAKVDMLAGVMSKIQIREFLPYWTPD